MSIMVGTVNLMHSDFALSKIIFLNLHIMHDYLFVSNIRSTKLMVTYMFKKTPEVLVFKFVSI